MPHPKEWGITHVFVNKPRPDGRILVICTNKAGLFGPALFFNFSDTDKLSAYSPPCRSRYISWAWPGARFLCTTALTAWIMAAGESA